MGTDGNNSSRGCAPGYVPPPAPPDLAGPAFTKPKSLKDIALAQTGEVDFAGDRMPRGQSSSFEEVMDAMYRAIHDADLFIF